MRLTGLPKMPWNFESLTLLPVCMSGSIIILAHTQWPFGHACIASTVLSLALPCGARALRVAYTWSTSEKSGAFSPTFTFFITNPLDVRTRSGAGLGAIRVNAPLMLGAKPDATIFSIFTV